MKKIAFIGMALILALGVMGAGFALWSDSLFVEGTIETGDIGLTWSQGDPYDTEDSMKNVSFGECEIIDDTLYITVFNAYPCIEYHFPIDLHGVGSVPVHTQMTLTSGPCPWVEIPQIPMQIHEGDVWNGEIVIHLDNTAEENETYHFTVQLDYWQYNEDPGPLPFGP